MARVMKSPELIHLLRLQDAFPKASISRMLRGNGNDNTTGPKGVCSTANATANHNS
jgi:hypothetical protein